MTTIINVTSLAEFWEQFCNSAESLVQGNFNQAGWDMWSATGPGLDGTSNNRIFIDVNGFGFTGNPQFTIRFANGAAGFANQVNTITKARLMSQDRRWWRQPIYNPTIDTTAPRHGFNNNAMSNINTGPPFVKDRLFRLSSGLTSGGGLTTGQSSGLQPTGAGATTVQLTSYPMMYFMGATGTSVNSPPAQSLNWVLDNVFWSFYSVAKANLGATFVSQLFFGDNLKYPYPAVAVIDPGIQASLQVYTTSLEKRLQKDNRITDSRGAIQVSQKQKKLILLPSDGTIDREIQRLVQCVKRQTEQITTQKRTQTGATLSNETGTMIPKG